MKRNMEDYDIAAIRDYLEDYFGTAMMSVSPYAAVDLINLSGKSDYEIFIMAINMGIIDDFYIGRRY